MLKLSESEQWFIEQGVDQNIRTDGRGRMDYRHIVLETGIISQTNGSARLRLENTDVLVGVKAEIGEPSVEFPDQGRLQFNVECCPSASPEFEGRGADSLNIELMRFLDRIFGNSFNLKELNIISGKQCWVLCIDVMVMDSGGNLFDALSLCSLAALHNTKIPSIKVINSEGEDEIEVSDDPEAFTKMDIKEVPICISFTRIGAHYVVDTTLEEELCMKSRLSVAVNRNGRIYGIQKGGTGSIDAISLPQLLKTAVSIGSEILKQLDLLLKKEDTGGIPKVGFFG